MSVVKIELLNILFQLSNLRIRIAGLIGQKGCSHFLLDKLLIVLYHLVKVKEVAIWMLMVLM